MRKPPLIPTMLVVLAMAAMVGLGIWQVQRAQWKSDLKARYARAAELPPIAFPTLPPSNDALPLYRHATGNCLKVVGRRATAGQNRAGTSGFVHIVDCATGAEGPGMSVELGWSANPNAQYRFDGGLVSGVIAPDRVSRMRLVAATPPAGLDASAPPSLAAIPDNHLFYAIQWFFFAALAGLIYWLALRRKWAGEAT